MKRQRAKPRERMMLEGNHPLLNFVTSPLYLPHPCDPFGQEGAVVYPTVEHRFQAMKGLYSLNQSVDEAHDYVQQADGPMAAKQRGRTMHIDSELWDMAAFGYMLEAHVAKFTQIILFQRQLLATGDAILIEHRKDPIWGDNKDGTGMNLCGKSLMIVRDKVLQ